MNDRWVFGNRDSGDAALASYWDERRRLRKPPLDPFLLQLLRLLAACTIRSRTGRIDSGRCCVAPGFGISTRREGSGR